MPAIPKHRKPIIDTAVSLFRNNGYANTPLNEIVLESGAPKGSFYHYFPKGKAAVAIAALEEAGARMQATLRQQADETATASDFLIAHGTQLGEWMRQSRFKAGCPITSILLHAAPESRAITIAGRKVYAMRLSIIQEKLEADGHTSVAAARLAILCLSALQGALIQARVETSTRAIDITCQELCRLIQAPQRG